jgi:hypothetical protein
MPKSLRVSPHGAQRSGAPSSWCAVAATLLLVLASPARASVLCQKKNGVLTVRPTSCKRVESAFDLTPFLPPVGVAPGGGLAVSGGSFSIAPGGVTGAQLADGAVSAAKLASDARAAAGSVVLSGTTNATTPTTLDSFTVDVPAPGTLLVTVSGFLLIDADATTASALTLPGRIGLCDTADSDGQCGGTYTSVWYQDADDTDDQNATPAFTLVRTVSVGSAGQRKFYLNGEKPADVAATSLTLWQDLPFGQGPVATAMFFPGPLTVTEP